MTDPTAALARLCALERAAAPPDIGAGGVAALARAAARHGVAGWLMKRLGESYADWEPAGALTRALRPHMMGDLLFNSRVAGALRRASDLLSRHGIEVAALKGAALTDSLYGDAGVRSTGDLDILVAQDKGYEAMEILTADGATPWDEATAGRPDVMNLFCRHLPPLKYCGVRVEIHTKLWRELSGEVLIDNAMSHTARCGETLRLDNEAMLAHLCAHAHTHHALDGHISLKWLIDIALLLRQDMSLLERSERQFPNTRADVEWAARMCMSLLPASDRDRLARTGRKATPLTAKSLRGNREPQAWRSVRRAWAALRFAWKQGDGIGGKCSNVVATIRYALSNSESLHPGAPAPAAIMKRIFRK